VVAIDINGGALVDLASHENNAVLQPHGKINFVLIKDLEDAFSYDIVLGI
jgi:hypothetical protein